MLVKELIELLQKENQDNSVLIYQEQGEDHGFGISLHIEKRADDDSQLYDKGDHPFSYRDELTEEVVTIVGYC